MGYYKVHCTKCGLGTSADYLAFDFDEVLKEALRSEGANEKWKGLLDIYLRLFITKLDMDTFFGVHFEVSNEGKRQEGIFKLTVAHLKEWLLHILQDNEQNGYDGEEVTFDALVEEAERRGDPADNNGLLNQLYLDLRHIKATEALPEKATFIMKIKQLVILMDKSEDDEVIFRAHIAVSFTKDDQGNEFPQKLEVTYVDGHKQAYLHQVCPMCGQMFHGAAGRFREIVIAMVGSARVGKTAYLASFVDGLEKNTVSKKICPIEYVPSYDEGYRIFCRDILFPYRKGLKPVKTPIGEGVQSMIPLFSLQLRILDRDYLFSFVDMPGEAFDNRSDDQFILNSRQIFKAADMFWICIDPDQLKPMSEVVSEDETGDDGVSLNMVNIMGNVSAAIQTIIDNPQENIRAAVLVTKSDRLSPEEQFYKPELNVRTEYFENGTFYYDRMKPLLKSVKEKMKGNPLIEANMRGWCHAYTPFPVASYGHRVGTSNNELSETGNQNADAMKPNPSLVEAPFVWSLCVLGLLPAAVEVPNMVERIFKEPIFPTIKCLGFLKKSAVRRVQEGKKTKVCVPNDLFLSNE